MNINSIFLQDEQGLKGIYCEREKRTLKHQAILISAVNEFGCFPHNHMFNYIFTGKQDVCFPNVQYSWNHVALIKCGWPSYAWWDKPITDGIGLISGLREARWITCEIPILAVGSKVGLYNEEKKEKEKLQMSLRLINKWGENIHSTDTNRWRWRQKFAFLKELWNNQCLYNGVYVYLPFFKPTSKRNIYRDRTLDGIWQIKLPPGTLSYTFFYNDPVL